MPRKTEREKGEAGKSGKGTADGSARKRRAPAKKGKGNESDALSPFPVFPFSPARTVRQTTVAIVGAGRLGTALARALAACGYHVAAVVARRSSHARRAATIIATGTPHTLALNAAQLDRLPVTDILIITTPDDRIADTAARLATSMTPPSGAKPDGATPDAAKRAKGKRRVALHASGALASDALAPLGACGFAVGSMHPLVAVSDAASGAESLRGAFYCLEGDGAAVGAARKLVRSLGGRSFSVNTADKALYHAAAVLASGHAVALFDIASELLARCGLSAAEARRILMPLVRSTLENLSTQTPRRALTGTFARADAATVRKHLAALRRPDTRAALDAYVLLGRRSLQLADANGADAEALRVIARELKEAEGSKRKAESGRQ